MVKGYRQLRRGVITIVGMAVVVIGVILLPLPGPGFLIIAAGFAILATEYEWARDALDWAKDRAMQTAEQATQRWWSSALAILTGLGMLAVGVALIVVEELPLSGLGTGIGIIFGAVALLATTAYAIYTPGTGHYPPDPELGLDPSYEPDGTRPSPFD